MTTVRFTITFPTFMDFLFRKHTRPVAGEVWHFSTKKVMVQAAHPDFVVVRTRNKSGIKIVLKVFIELGTRLDDVTI